MQKINLEKLLLKSINAAIKGGYSIMEVYRSDFLVEKKADKSPLTLADKNCNAIIEKELRETGIPILSEEGSSIPFSERKKWEYFWLVDPLDGTKEFIKQNGEFTVNIALICNGAPIMGVVYAPVKEELYFALKGLGSYKNILGINSISAYSGALTVDNLQELVLDSTKLPINHKRINYVMVGSRSHMSPETEAFFAEKEKEYGNVDVLAIGSSLKLCMVAEGKADAYPRYAPTMEWDTAAGHAIAKYAGFTVKQYNSSKDLTYNKEDLLNPWFLVN